MQTSACVPSKSATTVQEASEHHQERLWGVFDRRVDETNQKQSLTADASVEVQRYPSASYLPRGDNPLDY